MTIPYPSSRIEAEKLIASLQKDFGLGPVTVSSHFVNSVVRKATIGEHSLVDPDSAEMNLLKHAQRDLVRVMMESDDTIAHAVRYGTEEVTEALENSVDYLRSRLHQRGWKVRLFAPIGAGVHINPEDPDNQDLAATASGFRTAFEADAWALEILGLRLQEIRTTGSVELADRTEDGKTLPLMRYSLFHTSPEWVPETMDLEMNS